MTAEFSLWLKMGETATIPGSTRCCQFLNFTFRRYAQQWLSGRSSDPYPHKSFSNLWLEKKSQHALVKSKLHFLKVSRFKKVLFYVGPPDILMGSIPRWHQTVPITLREPEGRDETRQDISVPAEDGRILRSDKLIPHDR